MNVSSKWLGVMKSDVGWGGERFGGLCSEATPKLTSLLLLACSNSGQRPSGQRPSCLTHIYSKNVLEILGNPYLLWPTPSPSRNFPGSSWATWERSRSF